MEGGEAKEVLEDKLTEVRVDRLPGPMTLVSEKFSMMRLREMRRRRTSGWNWTPQIGFVLCERPIICEGSEASQAST